MNDLNSIILEGVAKLDELHEVPGEEEVSITVYSTKTKVQVIAKSALALSVRDFCVGVDAFRCRVVGRLEYDGGGVFLVAEHIEFRPKPEVKIRIPFIGYPMKYRVRDKQKKFDF